MHNLQADKELAKQITDALVRDHSIGVTDSDHAQQTVFTVIRRYTCGWYESNPNAEPTKQ
jgi:hypothetical protein